MTDLILKIKKELIEALNLDITPEEIVDDAPIFGEGLALDSIDALEIIVLLEKNYKIKLTDPEQAKKIFASIKTLAEFIQSTKK